MHTHDEREPYAIGLLAWRMNLTLNHMVSSRLELREERLGLVATQGVKFLDHPILWMHEFLAKLVFARLSRLAIKMTV